MEVTPNNGGCWFCNTDSGELYFSFEFDTYVHKDCVREKYEKCNIEAKIIMREFNWDNPEKEDIK
jgi:hypothetical protein